MKKLGFVFTLISIIASAIGLGAAIFFNAYRIFDHEEISSVEWYIRLNIAAIWLVPILVLGAVSLKRVSKGICIAGILICAISIYSTYGVSLVAILGFIFNYIFITGEEKKKEEMIESLPEEERKVIHNNDINYRYKHIDYREYVKKHRVSFIISIFIALLYIGLFIFGVFELTAYLYDKLDVKNAGLAIFGILLMAIFYFGFFFIVFLFMLVGLISPIMALVAPSRRVLKMNRVMGFVFLTILNGVAAIDILDEIDKNMNFH